eukprot:2512619-Rhodomonas_salina.1
MSMRNPKPAPDDAYNDPDILRDTVQVCGYASFCHSPATVCYQQCGASRCAMKGPLLTLCIQAVLEESEEARARRGSGPL